MGTRSREIGDEPNAAGIMFKIGMIKKIPDIDFKMTLHGTQRRRLLGANETYSQETKQ
jgi:hypothetical protein